MQDCMGNELQVGDTVAYVSRPGGKRHLVRGYIHTINAKTANVVNKEGNYQGYAHPEQIVKVPSEAQVIVSQEYLGELLEASTELSYLEAAGVDNWEGYDIAHDMRREAEGKEEEPEDE